MPVSWESHNRIINRFKPCGNHVWHKEAVERGCQEIRGKENAVVLDAGCGDDSWVIRTMREREPISRVIGFDIDESCRDNKDVDEARVASIYDVPFDSESVDLAISGYVLEHIDDPDKALGEIYRLLKPGACFITWTPNRWNPVMLLSSLTSQRFHVLLRRLTWGSEGADNAPTFYRVNTIGAIRSAAKRSGFVVEYAATFSSAYAYFRMNRVTFSLACLANKIMAVWPLTKLRLTLLCVMRKPKVA